MRTRHLFENVIHIPVRSLPQKPRTYHFKPSKLDVDIEKEICARYLSGEYVTDLSKVYGVRANTIREIVKRRGGVLDSTRKPRDPHVKRGPRLKY